VMRIDVFPPDNRSVPSGRFGGKQRF
jgi:hypothetical protein